MAATSTPMPDIQMNDASTIPGMLRRLDKPHSANVVQALIDEVTRLRAREADRPKLYVWENVLCDPMAGMIVVLAKDDEEAMIKLDYIGPGNHGSLEFDGVMPQVVNVDDVGGPMVWYVNGGG
ncbi:hypothetical protein V5E97_06860 [Singulisphaera sp. Ch08]|uniref:Uncharacterized protein n=1 Tax=Singulisphaera sp. Ch08 TaxID=3120278 RepID=A0AAU7CL43_9BACT